MRQKKHRPIVDSMVGAHQCRSPKCTGYRATFLSPTFWSLAFPTFFQLHDNVLTCSSMIHQVPPWTMNSLAMPIPTYSTSLLLWYRSLSSPPTLMCSTTTQDISLPTLTCLTVDLGQRYLATEIQVDVLGHVHRPEQPDLSLRPCSD